MARCSIAYPRIFSKIRRTTALATLSRAMIETGRAAPSAVLHSLRGLVPAIGIVS